VFPPVEHQGSLLVDGGVLDNLPVSAARERGADVVIAVDIGVDIENREISNLMEVIVQSINIMAAESVRRRKREADILISPSVGSVGMMDFGQKKACMQAGIEAAQRALPEIRNRIEAWRRA
jgi:NTE family protein